VSIKFTYHIVERYATHFHWLSLQNKQNATMTITSSVPQRIAASAGGDTLGVQLNVASCISLLLHP
jgi:hypothetical protein